MGKIWALCSGSGGVGKTTVALSLAVGAAKAGREVILLDASGPARACDLILGMESIVALDMTDVLSQQASLDAALYPTPRYPKLRLACASLSDGCAPTELLPITLALHSLCDILVIDLPTGQAMLGCGVLRAGDERIVVTRPDDASLRASEHLIQQARGEESNLSVTVNRLRPDWVKRKTQYSPETASMLLDCPILGSITEDDSLTAGAHNGRPAIECDGPAWSILSDMVRVLLSK